MTCEGSGTTAPVLGGTQRSDVRDTVGLGQNASLFLSGGEVICPMCGARFEVVGRTALVRDVPEHDTGVGGLAG